jgi:hypothetical protein
MNLKQNLSDKIHNFSTQCTINNINKNLFFPKQFPYKAYFTKNIGFYFKTTLYIVVISRIKSEFAAQPSRSGDQRCWIRNRIRIRSRSRNFLKSRIGSGVGFVTNHSRSTTLVHCTVHTCNAACVEEIPFVV